MFNDPLSWPNQQLLNMFKPFITWKDNTEHRLKNEHDTELHGVSEKTCLIFDVSLKKNGQITMIFWQTYFSHYWSSKGGFTSHLNYLVQLSYLVTLSAEPSYEFSLHYRVSQYYDVNM